MITVGELKAIIAQNNIPDEAEIYVEDGLNPLALARPERLVLGPGIALGPCRGVADQEKALQAERDKWPDDAEDFRAVSALVLYSEDAVEEMDYDEEDDEDDEDEEGDDFHR